MAGAGGTGSGSGGLGSGPAPITPEDCKDVPLDPGATYLRRLDNAEYALAVRELLGVDPTSSVQAFPADLTAREVNRGLFDNISESQTISVLHAQKYFSAAKQIASDVAASAQALTAAFGCDPGVQGPSCVAAGLEALGLKLYRRPTNADEKTQLAALAGSETDGLEATQVVLQAMLMSPSFLFRVEEGVGADAARPELVKLSGYELATRLSFFLLGRPPDTALLTAAQNGTLDAKAGVEATAQALLDDPRLRASFQRFGDQWFRTHRLLTAQRDTTQFPLFSAELTAAMQKEFELLLDEHVFSSAGRFLDLYTTRAGYVNDSLAALYGVAPPGSAELRRTELGANPDRGGLFTTGAFLASTVRGNETSVIHRGVYVRDVVLCDEVPQPPKAVTPPEIQDGESSLDAEQRHTQDPTCAGCHELINPVGHGLERYDALGGLRSVYSNGGAVKLTGYIAGLEPAQEYSGGVELGQIVSQSPQASRCVVKHAFRWAMGRFEHDTEAKPADACSMHQLHELLSESNYSFRALTIALVTSDTFRYRRPKETQE